MKHSLQVAESWPSIRSYSEGGGQGARWDGQLPRAVFLNGPVIHSLEFSKIVTDLLSK